MKSEKMAAILSLLILVLLTVHLSHDMIYGYEPARLKSLIATPFVALWLYAALALAGRRSGYVLLLVGGLVASVVPIVHLSGTGIREEVVQSSGGFFFILTLIALAMCASISFALSIHGFWRLKGGAVSLLWTVIAVAAAGAIGYLAYLRT